ncbi:MAG: aminodeoxychorismate/anthranilate synthase component II [Candidatus Methanomethylophilaceae archaeon]|nr:aminodeoxychorismate/anthranilate synthase component II [Candidatus Methanomethylophilaceae archaeon]MBR6911915.1 aminodeoxychorismate/anthranilate synthase component II [Candidatus Methanomethylophilaceae archaeon]
MILLIDNYDSFSYNLYQLIGSIEPDIRVIRNDELSVEEIDRLAPELIVISPGPGRPEDAGVCVSVVKELRGRYPILGICLGHQAICQAYGATVTYAKRMMHGKQSVIKTDSSDVIFQGLPSEITVARYHSLAADPETIPDSLIVTATADDGEVMAVMSRDGSVHGLQFHPESIMTPDGARMMENLLKSVRKG